MKLQRKMTIYSNRSYLNDKLFSRLEIDCTKIVSVSVGYLIIPDSYIPSSNEDEEAIEKNRNSNEKARESKSPITNGDSINSSGNNNKKSQTNKGKQKKKIAKKNKQSFSPELEEIEIFKTKLENSTVHKSFVYKIVPSGLISFGCSMNQSILIS